MIKSCKGCKWHDDFTWACFNGESPYRADFVNDGCEHYERESMNINSQDQLKTT